MSGNKAPFGRAEAPCNPVHLRVIAAPVGKGIELATQIARIKPGKARRPCTVAFAVHPVTGEACVAGAGASTAERDELAGRDEALRR